MKVYHAKLPTPFSVLGVTTEGERLIGIEFLSKKTSTLTPQNKYAEYVCTQLSRYLDDPEFKFNVQFNLGGTDYQRKVWRALLTISPGKTLTYGELAKRLNSSPRALGQACGANPIPVIIPCHRILSRSGLGGFMNCTEGNPLAIKTWLLAHEGV